MYFHSKGLAFNELKDYEVAIEMFNKSLKIDPNHQPSWFHLGLTYHNN